MHCHNDHHHLAIPKPCQVLAQVHVAQFPAAGCAGVAEGDDVERSTIPRFC